MTARPLADLPRVLGRFADAADKSVSETVPRATEALRKVVEASGRRFTLRGHNGAQVPLEARADVKRFNGKPVGRVRGVPAGFWEIVEHGSGPHLIVGRYKRSGAGPRLGSTSRINRRGRLVNGVRSAAGNVQRFADGTIGSDTTPIKTGGSGNYWQYAQHPGHGPIGHPWRTAMAVGADPVVRTLSDVSFKAFVQAFTQ